MLSRYRLFTRVALGVVVLLAGGVGAEAPEELRARVPEGFESLFNGTTLDGWEGATDLFSVEDRVIVGSTEGKKLDHNMFIYTEKDYADFELRISVKLRNHNSGIQFRSEALEGNAMAGYQADVAEKTYFGMLYEEKKRGIMEYWKKLTPEEQAAINGLAKLDDWNDYVIRCQGDRVIMTLNGTTTCDILDPEGAKSGKIGLQLHTGPEMKVYYRDLFIKVLHSTGPSEQVSETDETALLMPEIDRSRRERLERFQVPEGFTVEEVATDELIGSVVNMTFDHKGRPALASEGGGIQLLMDDDGDGVYDRQHTFCDEVNTAHGMHYIGDGDLLVHAKGPSHTALFRLRDTDGDDVADEVTEIQKSDGVIAEHGPHTIATGPDGYYYVLYGNHAHPARTTDPASPLYDTREDFLLERYVDPRGHANNIRAPGGTIHRVSPDFQEWRQLTGGFRNPFDFAMDLRGEILAYDSDMEWDFGLPWFRPTRAIHAIPGGDFGWRTGSSKWPFYFIDTLPSVDDIGRGSPVGTCVYYGQSYPERFRGAYIMGDWSRGRIRVLFPQQNGATYSGKTVDFVLGEPLNVTDLDVGPDGFLYFTVGGRSTRGGMYRLRYEGDDVVELASDGIAGAIEQPMPRAAWGKLALREQKAAMGDAWGTELNGVLNDPAASSEHRVRALELLQIHGPQPSIESLKTLAADGDPKVRDAAVYQLGAKPFAEVRGTLVASLADADVFVQRRASEALVRAGLDDSVRVFKPGSDGEAVDALLDNLFALLDSPDRFVRYSARNALIRVDRDAWENRVLNDDVTQRPHGAIEGLLALVKTAETSRESDAIFAKLAQTGSKEMADEILLDYLRVLGLAYIRDVADDSYGEGLAATVGSNLLARFPSSNMDLNRELQRVMAHMQVEEAIGPMLDYLTPDKTQEEQIHTVYALRAIKRGWTPEQREQLVNWFDRGREMGGAASMEGYINNLWAATMEILPEEERVAAEARKAKALEERMANALALIEEASEGVTVNSELAQMSFEELSDYLEYDPMNYKKRNTVNGRKVFIRSRCASCHVFGDIGKGGGPDLSTVVSRFRRSDILEAIMYPSRVISDQYIGVDIETVDFDEYRGMIAGENDETLTLITVEGQRIEIPKADITKRETATQSVMPEGLLHTMSLGDLVDLIAFLEKGSMPDEQG